ncbi:hypothetical protein E2C01_071748 [Portunus trituberculatus]|uniref:Uncharacterized protein n=1 Tax=Portunus trituberculatus TaxID=210409 RepID=A0A5B7I717_PORTR|nr:hypothetical protein [Portunus trituberculatus]
MLMCSSLMMSYNPAKGYLSLLEFVTGIILLVFTLHNYLASPAEACRLTSARLLQVCSLLNCCWWLQIPNLLGHHHWLSSDDRQLFFRSGPYSYYNWTVALQGWWISFLTEMTTKIMHSQ